MYKLITFFLTLFTFHNALSQYQISGTIVDENEAALSFVNVILLDEQGQMARGVVSDSSGQFTLENLSSGNYEIELSLLSYTPFRQTIFLTQSVDLGTIKMSSQTMALDGVTVTAKRSVFEHQADRTIINVGNMATASGGNALDLLERSPGVLVNQGSGAITMMGRPGVIITINGKRTRLGGNALIQYLASLPSNSIEAIELITNPPASFDAEGTGGVINIKIKNFAGEGFNGSWSVFAGYGERAKYGASGNFNFKKRKINLYGDFSTNRNLTNQNIYMLSDITFEKGRLNALHENLRPASIFGYNGKVGLEYALNKKTTIDVFAQTSKRLWKLNARAFTDYYTNEVADVNRDILESTERNESGQYILSSRLVHQWNTNTSLSIDYDYLNFSINNPTTYLRGDYDANETLINTLAFNSKKRTPFDFHVARIDYQGLAFENIKIQTGLKATISQVENETSLTYLETVPTEDSLFSSLVKLDETILAAYLSMEAKLAETYTINLGGRYEYFNTLMSVDAERIDRKIKRLFPNISLSKQFSETAKLTLAYRERINRPGFQNLAPAFYFLNANTVLTGNVRARPNINKTLEAVLNYKTLLVSLSFSKINDPIVGGQANLDQEQSFLLFQATNLEYSDQLNLSLSFPINFTHFWNSRYSVNSFWQKDKLIEAQQVFKPSYTYAIMNTQQEFALSKSLNLELSANWNSRIPVGNAYFGSRLSFSIGVQKELKNKAKIAFAWQDLFDNGSFFEITNDQPQRNIYFNWLYEFEGNIFRLSYTMPLGKQNDQRKKQRSSGSEDVLRRIQQ